MIGRGMRAWLGCASVGAAAVVTVVAAASCAAHPVAAPATEAPPAARTPPAAVAPPVERRSPAGLRVTEMRVGAETVVVEVADTTPSRSRGLGGRTQVPRGTGMFFHFPYSTELRFWMKDCSVAIDVAFLDDQGVVTATYTMPAEPLRGEAETQAEYESRLTGYPSRGNARYALELGAGELQRLGIAKGTRLALPVRTAAP